MAGIFVHSSDAGLELGFGIGIGTETDVGLGSGMMSVRLGFEAESSFDDSFLGG